MPNDPFSSFKKTTQDSVNAAKTITDPIKKVVDKVTQTVQPVTDAGKKVVDTVVDTVETTSRQGRDTAGAAAAAGTRGLNDAVAVVRRITRGGDSAAAVGPLQQLIATRRLHQKEIDLARSVFGDSLPYLKIVLSSDAGLSDRQWTSAEPNGTYVVHCGSMLFRDVTRTDVTGFHDSKGNAVSSNSMIIHELTHVWQGEWWQFHTQYEFNSVFQQTIHCFDVNAAYMYENGGTWSQYTAEQQAMIVQDWFTGGGASGSSTAMDPASPSFPYISLRVRAGDNAGLL